jgi:hypothetical protein
MTRAWCLLALLTAFVLTACDGNGGDEAFFTDGFDTPGAWRTSSDPEVEIAYANGGLTIEIKVIDRVAWSVAGRDFKDGVVSVDATPIGGPDDNAYGLIVRHEGDRSFYRFEISADGYYAVQAPKGALGWEFLADWTESSAIRRGRETNKIEVKCQAQTMTFYVNEVQVAQVTDGRYREGDVGVIAGTFYNEPGTYVLFDDFTVEPLED